MKTAWIVALAAMAAATGARGADLVLVGGRIVTLDRAEPVQAIAIDGDRIEAVGTSAAMRRLAGPKARVIDLKGRTVIPGLIDSHMHAVRAGLSYATEVDWIGARSLPEALARIGDAGRQGAPGRWLIVAGGWTPGQFAERRPPTLAELMAAAPDRPAYVQLSYERALLTPKAMEALGLKTDADLPPGARIERDAAGQPTGWIVGGIIELFARLPTPTDAEQAAGTRLFFRRLNRLGLTGVVDPGGFGMTPDKYRALFKVWRDGELTVRVAYSMNAEERGKELERFKQYSQMAPAQLGDDWLHLNGIGERVTLAMYNNDAPTEEQKQAFYDAIHWAAAEGQTFTIHWQNNRSVGILLDLMERLNRDIPLAPLHWTIAHLNDADEASLRRMKALGVGWTLQDEAYFAGDRPARSGAPPNLPPPNLPPIVTAIRLGVPIGAGTDAHRVMSYNPFTALQWMLDGRTVTGRQTRFAPEIPSRIEALRLYTLGSAWVSRDEARRGSLAPGKLADLAVLSADYLTLPTERIGALESVLTVVGGKIVYAGGPYARLDPSASRP